MQSHLLTQTHSTIGSRKARWSVVIYQPYSTFVRGRETLSPPFPNGVWRWVQTPFCSLSVRLTISPSAERKELLMLQMHCALHWPNVVTHGCHSWLDKSGYGDSVRRRLTWSAAPFQICIFAALCVLLARIGQRAAAGAFTANLARSWTWGAGMATEVQLGKCILFPHYHHCYLLRFPTNSCSIIAFFPE